MLREKLPKSENLVKLVTDLEAELELLQTAIGKKEEVLKYLQSLTEGDQSIEGQMMMLRTRFPLLLKSSLNLREEVNADSYAEFLKQNLAALLGETEKSEKDDVGVKKT